MLIIGKYIKERIKLLWPPPLPSKFTTGKKAEAWKSFDNN